MITALTATAAALAIGLPIFALGEHFRERRTIVRRSSPARKDPL